MKTLALSIVSFLFLSASVSAQMVAQLGEVPSKVKEAPKSMNVQASFQGGEEAFYDYLLNEIKFPRMVSSSANALTAVVSFQINEDGSCTDIRIEQSVSKKMDAQLIKALQKMPKWNPAINNGTPSKIKWVQDIKIELN
jgi:protein TonB